MILLISAITCVQSVIILVLLLDRRRHAREWSGQRAAPAFNSEHLRPVEPDGAAPADEVLPVSPVYKKSGLSAEQIEAHWQAIETVMKLEKLYVDPTLSLGDLAERLNLSRQQVSQVLNQRAGQKFYVYVNEYRGQAMRQLLRKKPESNILSVMVEVGFQSKTTANAYFRKLAGCSPSEYQHRITTDGSADLIRA